MTHKMIAPFLCFTTLMFMVSCKKVNDKNPALFGKWQGTEWLVMDRPSGLDAAKVNFEFMEDGTYTARFGNQDQIGVWRTEKDKLYTTENGKKEIMVKLLQYDGKVLDFEMNRGGQKEILKLVKQ
jgi:hypothetical protein